MSPRVSIVLISRMGTPRQLTCRIALKVVFQQVSSKPTVLTEEAVENIQ